MADPSPLDPNQITPLDPGRTNVSPEWHPDDWDGEKFMKALDVIEAARQRSDLSPETSRRLAGIESKVMAYEKHHGLEGMLDKAGPAEGTPEAAEFEANRKAFEAMNPEFAEPEQPTEPAATPAKSEPGAWDMLKAFSKGPGSLLLGQNIAGLGAAAWEPPHQRTVGRGTDAPVMPRSTQEALAWMAGRDAEAEEIEKARDVRIPVASGKLAGQQVDIGISPLKEGQFATVAASGAGALPSRAITPHASTILGRLAEAVPQAGVPSALAGVAGRDPDSAEDFTDTAVGSGMIGTGGGALIGEGVRVAPAVTKKLHGMITRMRDKRKRDKLATTMGGRAHAEMAEEVTDPSSTTGAATRRLALRGSDPRSAKATQNAVSEEQAGLAERTAAREGDLAERAAERKAHTQADLEDIRQHGQQIERAATVADDPAHLATQQRQVADDVDLLQRHGDRIRAEEDIAQKGEHIRAAMVREGVEPPPDAGAQTVDEIHQAILERRGGPRRGARAEELTVDQAENTALNRAEDAISIYRNRLKSITDPADRFLELDQLKRALQKEADRAYSRAGGRNAGQFFEEVQGRLRKDLESADMWGSEAAGIQVTRNRAWHDRLKATKKAADRKFTREGDTTSAGTSFRGESEVQEAPTMGLVRRAGDVEAEQEVGDFVRRAHSEAGLQRALTDTPPDGATAHPMRGMADESAEAAGRIERTMKTRGAERDAANTWKQLREGSQAARPSPAVRQSDPSEAARFDEAARKSRATAHMSPHSPPGAGPAPDYIPPRRTALAADDPELDSMIQQGRQQAAVQSAMAQRLGLQPAHTSAAHGSAETLHRMAQRAAEGAEDVARTAAEGAHDAATTAGRVETRKATDELRQGAWGQLQDLSRRYHRGPSQDLAESLEAPYIGHKTTMINWLLRKLRGRDPAVKAIQIAQLEEAAEQGVEGARTILENMTRAAGRRGQRIADAERPWTDVLGNPGRSKPGVEAAERARPAAALGMGREVPAAAPAMQPAGALADATENQSPEEQREVIASKARGFSLADAARNAIDRGGTELGPYLEDFKRAAESEDSTDLAALINRLSQTETEFRQQVLPRLQARTVNEENRP